MRLLFKIDAEDYDINGKAFIRPSVRSIIIKNGKVAMVHSIKYDYYKFPGGGIENGESQIDALIRETIEESGLMIKLDSIKEYGYVHRIQKSDREDEDLFVQDNYYYLCDVEENTSAQNLDDYEKYEKFTLEYIDPLDAIKTNRFTNHGPKDQNMIEREAKVLDFLINEGYFN